MTDVCTVRFVDCRTAKQKYAPYCDMFRPDTMTEASGALRLRFKKNKWKEKRNEGSTRSRCSNSTSSIWQCTVTVQKKAYRLSCESHTCRHKYNGTQMYSLWVISSISDHTIRWTGQGAKKYLFCLAQKLRSSSKQRRAKTLAKDRQEWRGTTALRNTHGQGRKRAAIETHQSLSCLYFHAHSSV